MGSNPLNLIHRTTRGQTKSDLLSGAMFLFRITSRLISFVTPLVLAVFFAPCYSSDSIVAFGAGLEVTYSAKSNVFTVDASSLEDKEGLSFDVKIVGPENANVQADVTDLHKGLYSV